MSHICIRTHKSFFFIRLEFYKDISEMLHIKERLSLKDPQKMMSPTAWDPSIPHPTHLIFLFFFGTRPSLSLSLSLSSLWRSFQREKQVVHFFLLTGGVLNNERGHIDFFFSYKRWNDTRSGAVGFLFSNVKLKQLRIFGIQRAKVGSYLRKCVNVQETHSPVTSIYVATALQSGLRVINLCGPRDFNL